MSKMKESITIKIDDEYSIVIDDLNHTLIREKHAEENEKARKIIVGYFSNTENALMRYVKSTSLQIADCDSVKMYVEKIEKHISECMVKIRKALSDYNAPV